MRFRVLSSSNILHQSAQCNSHVTTIIIIAARTRRTPQISQCEYNGIRFSRKWRSPEMHLHFTNRIFGYASQSIWHSIHCLHIAQVNSVGSCKVRITNKCCGCCCSWQRRMWESGLWLCKLVAATACDAPWQTMTPEKKKKTVLSFTMFAPKIAAASIFLSLC